MGKTERITREKIILAFLNSCFEKNAGGTSLSDVSGRLGIKKASLYNHYESRDAMVDDCIKWCSEYMQRTYFIPADIDQISRKYTAESVMKGIVNRWFKMNEKEPLFQIYSFIESEKYISTQAAQIASSNKEKLIAQTKTALKSLSAAGKVINLEESEAAYLAKIFVGMLTDNLDSYLVQRKIEIRSNPVSGEGSLFGSVGDDSILDKVDSLIENFCGLLK